MKKKFLLLWLLLPVPVIALHYGPGQRWLARDEAALLIARARDAETRERFTDAATRYLEAAAKLGQADAAARARCELAAAQARANDGDAAGALGQLDTLLDDARSASLPEDVRREARDLYASTSYYAAWVMRLEGAEREDWGVVAEDARQQFRFLAEQAPAADGDAGGKNVEAAVRLQRMSLPELMAKPLPKNCQSMCNKDLVDKMKKRCNGKCNKPGHKPGKKPQDLRDDEPKRRGMSERTEGMGS